MQEDEPPEIRDEAPPSCIGDLIYDDKLHRYRHRRRGDPVCVL